MLFYILFFIFLGISYYFVFKRNSEYWKKRDVTYEKQNTSLGTIWDFFSSNRSLAEICKDIYDKYPKDPYIGLLWGSKTALLLRDPEVIQQVLTADFQNFTGRGFVTNPQSDLLSDNVLFTDDYPKWKLLRQKLSPLFTSSRLKNMFYILQHSGRDFIKFVDQNLSEDPFSLLYRYTTASIGSAVFGIDTKAQNTMNSPFLDMSLNSVAPSFINNLRFFIGNVSVTLFKLLKIKIFGDHEDFFIGVVKSVLRERQHEQKRHDFIDLCVELQKNCVMKDPNSEYQIEVTDELIAAQAYFFFLAGADTSANTMNFVLLELAQNPDILKRVQKEIDEVFSQSEDKPSYEDIDKMEYLEMVMNEAMRKYPPIGILQRKCTNTTVLNVENLKVEKDVIMIIPVFALHRDEKYYPKPEVFDPERFRNNVSAQAKYTFLPFGEGNRFCLGARFARLQVKIGLASLLSRFTVQSEAETPKDFEQSFFSIRSTDKKYYSIHPRIITNEILDYYRILTCSFIY